MKKVVRKENVRVEAREKENRKRVRKKKIETVGQNRQRPIEK